VRFTYLEKYGGAEVRRSVVLDRRSLKPGKWFYLRAPKLFIEKILPKLTHKLEDFAEIKFGIKSGANDFFYMKDISHLFEMDYLTKPQKFEEWGVKARTSEELEKEGLIYIENEGGERFVLEKEGVAPLIRTIRDYETPLIHNIIETYCLYIKDLNNKPLCANYIKWGKGKTIEVTRGSKRRTVKGYHSLSTTKARPVWYVLPNLNPSKITLPEFFSMRFLSFFIEEPSLSDHLFDMAYPKKEIYDKALWSYLNSTIYFMMLELWSPRMGGGGGALHPRTREYKNIPTPDIDKLYEYLQVTFGKRPTLPYHEEIKQLDKIKLDIAVLKGLGYDEETAKSMLAEIYVSYIELVNDRLLKAGKHTAKKVKEIMDKEQLDIETFRRIIDDKDN